MIYWDNAATTWPKPPSVVRAVGQAMQQFGANPGRAGHRMSIQTAEMVYECRQAVADYFGLSDPAGVVFTQNCTMALNMVIQGLARNSGRVLTSDMEHNAVVRPLAALSVYPRYDTAAWSACPEEIVENFRRAIRPDTKLVLCTHASNVFGTVFPIREIGELAHEYGLLFCVDAAQTAGVLPIHMEKDHIDFLCVAPHKGLYAPMGTGLLLCRNKDALSPLIRGGTGSYSLQSTQPDELPERLESGTLNTPGICGIHAGIRFVQEKGREQIYQHEIQCLRAVYHRLAGCPAVEIYTACPQIGTTAPVLSINIRHRLSEDVAEELNRNGIAVRSGLHCAPWAHRRFNTIEQGTIRLAPSAFSGIREAEIIAKVFLQIAEKSLHRSKNML